VQTTVTRLVTKGIKDPRIAILPAFPSVNGMYSLQDEREGRNLSKNEVETEKKIIIVGCLGLG
jgi:hypothetical protein